MLKDKIRIYVLAKELDVDCKDLIALCHRLEFDIKNQLSSLEPVQREEVETIAGLLIAELGALPSEGDIVTITLPEDPSELVSDLPVERQLVIEVLRVERYVPTQVRVTLVETMKQEESQ